MNETDYCNMISNAINEHFRDENGGFDSDVFVDERIMPGVIALNWHTFLNSYVTTEYVTRVAEFVFSKFSEVEQILSPCKDFKRKIKNERRL